MQTIYNFLETGGWTFTFPMTVLALTILGCSIKKTLDLFITEGLNPYQLHKGMDTIIYLGSFCFIFGIFGQIIGLYGAMQAIEKIGQVSPKILAGGLKVSSITTLYGFFIFLISSVLWFVLRSRYKHLTQNQ